MAAVAAADLSRFECLHCCFLTCCSFWSLCDHYFLDYLLLSGRLRQFALSCGSCTNEVMMTRGESRLSLARRGTCLGLSLCLVQFGRLLLLFLIAFNEGNPRFASVF